MQPWLFFSWRLGTAQPCNVPPQRASWQHGDAVEEGTEAAAEVVSAVVRLRFEDGERGDPVVGQRLPAAVVQTEPVPRVGRDGCRSGAASAPACEPVQGQDAADAYLGALLDVTGPLVLHVVHLASSFHWIHPTQPSFVSPYSWPTLSFITL